jgi:hypothetical protein
LLNNVAHSYYFVISTQEKSLQVAQDNCSTSLLKSQRFLLRRNDNFWRLCLLLNKLD